MNPNVVTAHKLCTNNRPGISKSSKCGCFYCLAVFLPSEITEWVDLVDAANNESGITALCPHCGIDSVIHETADFTISPELLGDMKRHWF